MGRRMKLNQWLYMAETEGHSELVNTRRAKINNLIKDLNRAKGKIDLNANFAGFCYDNDLDPYSFSLEEQRYINSHI